MDHEHQARLTLPTSLEAQRARQDARRKYQRVLANWASDVLVLRQSGNRSHAWRPELAHLGWWNKAA